MNPFAPVDFSNLYAVCVHEAGHAVIFHALGSEVDNIILHYIAIERLWNGEMEPVDLHPRDKTYEKIQIQLGGRAAERFVLNQESVGAIHDLRIVRELLRDFSNPQEILTAAEEAVGIILSKYKDQVIQIAKILEELAICHTASYDGKDSLPNPATVPMNDGYKITVYAEDFSEALDQIEQQR